jgi:hypothetical protein
MKKRSLIDKYNDNFPMIVIISFIILIIYFLNKYAYGG